jgi:hypothetical protein
MSAFSTLRITRGAAMRMMIQEITGPISDERLERFLDELLRDRLYNVRIISDYEQDNDDDLLPAQSL